MEAKVGLDTFCHPDALFSKEVVKDDELLPSKVLLEGVGADVKPLGQATKQVKLEGGANLTLTGEVLKELPGGVDVLIGGKPLAEQGFSVHGDEVRVAEKQCKRVPLGATEEKNELARWEAKLEEERRRLRHEYQRALNNLQENNKDFVKLRRKGRVTAVELGEDGKMYAHVDGDWLGGKVHGNFYRDENAQPNKPEKPRVRRYKASKPMPKERIGSRLGDVELTEQQEREWKAARQAEQHAREAEELAEEKRKLEAKAERLQNEQDAWDAAVAAVRAKGTPEGEAAREQEEQDDAVAEELEAKLEELEKARAAGKKLKAGRYKQIAATALKSALGGQSKAVVAAAVLSAVKEAMETKETQHIELTYDEARVSLQQCTVEMPEMQPAAPSVPKTARAAEVVSSSGWTSTPSGEVFGGEGQMDSERVDFVFRSRRRS